MSLSCIFHCTCSEFICTVLRIQIFSYLLDSAMQICSTMDCNIVIHLNKGQTSRNHISNCRENLKRFQNHWQKKNLAQKKNSFMQKNSASTWLLASRRVFPLLYCAIAFWKVILHAIKMDNKLSHFFLRYCDYARKFESFVVVVVVASLNNKMTIKTEGEKRLWQKLNSPYN